MQAFVMIAGVLIALIGQKLKSNPRISSDLVRVGLLLAGLGLYLVVDQPKGFGQPFFDWLDKAYVWALALPGLASLMGMAPALKTNDGGTT